MERYCVQRFAAMLLSTAVAAAQAAPVAARRIAVQVRVLDQVGQPIEGAGMLWSPTPTWTTEQLATGPLGRSDQHGLVRVELDAVLVGTGEIVVGVADRMVACATVWPELSPGAAVVDLGVLHLFAGATLHGRVRDGEGRPLTGVRVEASDPIQAWQYQLPTQVPLRWATAVLTDERGMYRLPGAPTRTVHLTFAKPGYYDETVFPARVDTPVDVTLAPSGLVRGRVVGGSGELQLDANYERGCDRSHRVEVDAEGRFAASIRGRGPFSLRAYDRSSRATASSPMLAGPAENVTVDLLGGPGSPLRLLVTAAGAPVPAFRVAAWWGADPEARRLLPDSFPREPLPLRGRDGAIDLRRPVSAARGVLMVAADGFALQRVAVTATSGGEVVARLQPGAVITGRVVDASTGAPLAGARVFAVESPAGLTCTFNMPPLTAITGADGCYRIVDVPAGPCVVQVDHADCALPDPVRVVLAAGGTEQLADAAVTALPHLRGRLVGAPVPAGAMVGPASRFNVTVWGWVGLKYTPNRHLVATAVAADGTFDLGPAAGATELLLFLPPVRYCGMPLGVPLGAVSAAEAVQEIALPTPLACRVHGTVALADEVRDVVALRVLAIQDHDEVQPGVRLPGIASRIVGASDLDVAGGYGMELPRGSYHMVVQDMVTGLLVLELPELAIEAEQQDHRLDLDAPLRRVTVRFDAATAAAVLPFGCFTVVAEGEGDQPSWRRLLFGGWSGAPIPFGPARSRCAVGLPAGRFAVRARAAPGGNLGEQLFEVSKQSDGEWAFRVEPPPTAGGDRK